jgi:hypothetical protein
VRVTTLARDASIRITDACGMRLDTRDGASIRQMAK